MSDDDRQRSEELLEANRGAEVLLRQAVVKLDRARRRYEARLGSDGD